MGRLGCIMANEERLDPTWSDSIHFKLFVLDGGVIKIDGGCARDRNRHRRNAHTHDLHGQTVQEAKRAVDTLLAVPLQLKSILDLRLIVGRGLHSGGGQAVLGPAILEYLQSVPAVKDVKYNPGNDGEILAVVDATGS